MYSKRPTASSTFYLASTERTPVANSEERLHSLLATLEECRLALIDSDIDSGETAPLLSVAILALRMKLNRIEDTELKVLCDAMLPNEAPAARPQEPQSPQGHGRPLLKLVK